MRNFALVTMISIVVLYSASRAGAQCVQMINYPADTVGWVRYADHAGNAFYNNDTFVITTSHGAENNYLYNSFPVTLFGTASAFSASFDFRLDSLSSCSDGLSFWFLTSNLDQLGQSRDEGCALGFPDTTNGFTLAMQTTVCMDNIYLLKIQSNSFSFCGMSPSSTSYTDDTIIATPLSSQMFLSDSQWHHCIVNYANGYITASYDAGRVVMSGYSPIYGTGHFGFVATNGGGYTRKCLKNIQICAGYGTPTVGADSFGTYVNRLCNGPQIEVHANTYFPSYHVVTYFGDGTNSSSVFASDMMGGGFVTFSHTYQSAGDYTIREILYNGSTAIDSLHFDYENVFCATLPVKFYDDANNDCLKESSEPYMELPILTEVDSNGVAVDTVSATGGFYYNAHGSIGDIYSFKIISAPGNMNVSCPSSNIVYDSLVPGIFIYPIKYFGLSCGTGTDYDLSVNAVIPVTGIHDEWGDVYVNNDYCTPTSGTLTLHYSPKYAGAPSQVTPTPTSITGGSIVWDISALSSISTAPTHLHYQVNYGSTTLTVGDTVRSYFVLTPVSGDVDTLNNYDEIIDTVKAGCDPNEMSVIPPGCMSFSTGTHQLQYTISFNNVGNDTAFNIYVLDTLPGSVDPKSLRIVMSSHNMNTSVYTNGPYTVAKFIFPEINLVDSATCPQCNGAVVFNIKTLSGLPTGSKIFNRAGVFFDDNPVVLTNAVENIIDNCSILAVNTVHAIDNIDIFPNPVSNLLTVNSSNQPIDQISITNILGQQVYQLGGAASTVVSMNNSIGSQTIQIDISALPDGVYFVKLNRSLVRKFIKE